MIFSELNEVDTLRKAIIEAYRMDETKAIEHLLSQLKLSDEAKNSISKKAMELATDLRKNKQDENILDTFFSKYDLSSEEGIAFMHIVGSLLRIPDKATRNKFLQEKMSKSEWISHLCTNKSVNSSALGMKIAGKVLPKENSQPNKLTRKFQSLLKKSSAPIMSGAIEQVMQALVQQFVIGSTIEEALKQSAHKGGFYSYNMLGESASTQESVESYFQSYKNAIQELGRVSKSPNISENPCVSIKLSALHPLYNFSKRERVLEELPARLLELAVMAKNARVGLMIDAERVEQLDLSLDVFERVFCEPALDGWEGFGLTLQAYQKRAWYTLDWLIDLSKQQKKKIALRLTKGAYWDQEIKLTQERGLEGYPVFTRKANTDISFLTCAQKILATPDVFYPQFATHNAYSIAAVLEMAGERGDYEFQSLYGMIPFLCDYKFRIYAPVGGQEASLSYLLRRLVERGSKSCFLNRLSDPDVSIEDVVKSPIKNIFDLKIPLPRDLYNDMRKNSYGLDLTNWLNLEKLAKGIRKALKSKWSAKSTFDKFSKKDARQVYTPADHTRQIGSVAEATPEVIKFAIEKASDFSFSWNKTPVNERATFLEKAADLLEGRIEEFIALTVFEAGKTIPNAIGEVREAVDFCRYYARRARIQFGEPKALPGPTGERNQLSWHGRGPVLCISPWNFPLAIFLGQVTAALVAGNPVIAKPASQTAFIASKAIDLFHEAGVPKEALQLLIASGSLVGEHLVPDTRIKGVVFTGSTETAQFINRTLANREGPITPLIAETGGQNAMIADSSASIGQVVQDAISSAFDSAGQRCSALRVLFVQEEIADKVIDMLCGAMKELTVGAPELLSTDVGPVIDYNAKKPLEKHVQFLEKEGRLLYRVSLPEWLEKGSYFAPCAYEIPDINILKREVFGPILHVVRYNRSELDKIIEGINNTGYGLTSGIHSRIDETVKYIHERIRAGNAYVNRNVIGAIVGVQPFGGEGLSGTGPKAGGPHYLLRLGIERTLSVNTAAIGGDVELASLNDG